MYRWIDRFVPSLGGRADLVLKERMLVMSALVLALAALAFGVHAARLQGEIGGISVVLWGGALLALTYPYLQKRTGSAALPGTLIGLEFAALTGLVAFFGNGSDGVVLIWAPTIPLLTAFLVGPRAALATAAFAAAVITLLFWMDGAGLTPPDTFEPAQLVRLRLLALVSGLGLSAFLGWLYESQTLRGLRRINHDLLEAKERAEASERLKSALLMNMSHEVRTPLTGILVAAELLQGDTEGELADIAGAIHTSGARLLATLEAVLELAQVEGGALAARAEPLDLAGCLHDAVEPARAAASRKGLALELLLPAEPVRAEADPAMVRRILALLLDNAVKFTETGGVYVHLGADERAARIAVEDTGPGIGADFLPHAFEAFRQESDGHARSHEGAGLGLTLAQRLAALQGGSLSAESRRGRGSTFTLSLPLAAPVPPQRKPVLHPAPLQAEAGRGATS